MKFTTQSGSLYEVDLVLKRIRRLVGVVNPQPRQGKDGEWKIYKEILGLSIGFSAMIIWPESTPLLAGSPKGAIPSTITSPIVETVED